MVHYKFDEPPIYMEEILRQVLSQAFPHREDMSKLITKYSIDALQLVEQPDGKFLVSKSLYIELLTISGISDSLLKSFIKEMAGIGYVATNPFYNLLVLFVLVFLADNDLSSAKNATRFLTAINLSYLKQKYIPICNETTLKYTLSMLHGHSTAREGFAQLCLKVADETLNVYMNAMVNDLSVRAYYRFLIDIRNKLNQSMKLIARRYYKNMEEFGKETNMDVAEKIIENLGRIASNYSYIEFIAKRCGLSTYEVELVVSKMNAESSFTYLLKDLIAKILFKLGGIDAIKQIGIDNSVSRLIRTDEVLQFTLDILEETQTDKTQENIKLIIFLAAILIFSYR